jgi:hypothetical protein
MLATLIKKCADGKNDNFSKFTYPVAKINELNVLGLGWNALFTKCTWIIDISPKLVKAKKFFEIKRGSRRGWDDMFYPTGKHGIEAVFLVPFLKSPSSIKNFLTNPDSVAFCCNISISELRCGKFNGAINWIKKFEDKKNGKNKLLPEVLGGSRDTPWYSMSPNEIADIVTSINPGDRLFFARLNKRSPVNQRLIRFVKKNDVVDLDLLHALMNSVISLFYLEAIGFGRGMGALDINAQNLSEKLCILNPELIDDCSKDKIKAAFKVICNREIKTIMEELKSSDRQQFEHEVFSAFNLLDFKDNVISSLEDLYNLRTSVNR